MFALPQQSIKLRSHALTVSAELRQKAGYVRKAQGVGDPLQISLSGWQQMGLLVVQVLNAVLDLSQKHIGFGQRVRGLSGHEFGLTQTF